MRDRTPEHTTYRDTGCSLFAACLACELPACRFELPANRPQHLKAMEPVDALLARGASISQVVTKAGVSRSTVMRRKRELRTEAGR